jgi:hypothetical protein
MSVLQIEYVHGKGNGFYVYVIHDPRPSKDNHPIYVGKGKGNRVYTHVKNSHNRHLNNTLNLCLKIGLKAVTKIFHVENEDVAFLLEKTLITQYGRYDLGTGTLYNLTDGGEGASGVGPEARLIMAENGRKVLTNPKYRRKLYDGQKEYWTDQANVEAQAELMREQVREGQQKYWANPANREAQAERASKQAAERRAKEGPKPWVVEGISRATWYRQRKAKEGPQPWVVEGISESTWCRRRRAKKPEMEVKIEGISQ